MSFFLQSPAFSHHEPIPQKHTGEGEDVSPPLKWSNAPSQAVEFALIVDDPDAPRPDPWVHWLIYRIPPTTNQLPAGVPREATPGSPEGAMQGLNSWPTDNVGYRGPMPPPGHGVHHYHFKLYALDTRLALGPGATKKDLESAMRDHILAETELVGTYERK